jgi:hypothetical protein
MIFSEVPSGEKYSINKAFFSTQGYDFESGRVKFGQN